MSIKLKSILRELVELTNGQLIRKRLFYALISLHLFQSIHQETVIHGMEKNSKVNLTKIYHVENLSRGNNYVIDIGLLSNNTGNNGRVLRYFSDFRFKLFP